MKGFIVWVFSGVVVKVYVVWGVYGFLKVVVLFIVNYFVIENFDIISVFI